MSNVVSNGLVWTLRPQRKYSHNSARLFQFVGCINFSKQLLPVGLRIFLFSVNETVYFVKNLFLELKKYNTEGIL